VILGAFACKALIGKAIEKAKEKYVQWATERQIKKWQQDLGKQLPRSARESERERSETGARGRRIRDWESRPDYRLRLERENT
jgi:hypothetical protein